MRKIAFHVRKTRVELIPLSRSEKDSVPPVQATLVLNDFAPHGVEVLSTGPLPEAIPIRLRIQLPLPIEISGKIAFCRAHLTAQNILSDFSVTHRLGIQFQPATPEEEQAIAQFCQEVARLIMPQLQNQAAPKAA